MVIHLGVGATHGITPLQQQWHDMLSYNDIDHDVNAFKIKYA